ncbi:MAG: hydroxyacylglutathione hydrolase [Candidatus Azotimanducaceae bacterium]|uniref:Hydroxyacylglutathione hydrolase n=1 Tax=OM182 bacterium TaxID=2510334 RepID=A0A520S4I8_9GAMM|nr:hydroxyacylglutathione hydrolase [Gammaproteobacteria bacterium]OUV68152.1 MAG: hydroxyacylglutathione hydrolase [Gammaproteobacteria bacterium TMED133]RZO77361.1 MAG: hydroxyacylglutathione hydrolase [OM182 bacterium]
MIVEQIWTGNSFRNFNYLVACPDTGEALAIDPLDYKKCLHVAEKMGWSITKVLNTHEHGDHIGGNQGLIKATGAKLLAHENAKDHIDGMDVGLKAGDVVKVGNSLELLVLDTPGHTMAHVCLLSQTDTPALFSGDTLFNAGAGNCHGGGHPVQLYETFINQLAKLSDDTLIYPGHDYMTNNLEFTLARETDNLKARALLAETKNTDPNDAFVSSLAIEKEINTFFRLRSPSLLMQLSKEFPDLEAHPDPETVFLKLRELRNDW